VQGPTRRRLASGCRAGMHIHGLPEKLRRLPDESEAGGKNRYNQEYSD